jgi:hypothetical protein
MVDTNRRRRFAPFVGALFCFFLTMMTLGPLDVGGGSNSGSLTPFLSFLPICFLLMGFTMKEQDDRTQERIQKLETALAARDEKTTG